MSNNVLPTTEEDQPSVNGQQGIPAMGVRNNERTELTDNEKDESRFAANEFGHLISAPSGYLLFDQALSLPTGPAVEIHPVLNTETNVYDTGWKLNIQWQSLLSLIKTNGPVDLFILNAPDDAGTDFTGADFALTTTVAGIPTAKGSDLFPSYVRAVIVNTSGSLVTGHYGGKALNAPLGDVLAPIAESILPFIPATSNRSAAFNLTEVGDFRAVSSRDTDAGRSTHVAVTEFDPPVKIDPCDDWDVKETLVGGVPVQLNRSGATGVKGVMITNESPTVPVFVGKSSDPNSIRQPIAPNFGSVSFSITEDADFWAVLRGSPSVQTTITKQGSTASGTAASPSNALTINGSVATMSADGQTLDVDGFSSAGVTNIAQVCLKATARKAASPASKTAAFVDVVTGTAGNTSTVTSGTATSDAGHTYIAFVSRRNTSASVTGISGLGLTWSPLVGDAVGGRSRASCWMATGTPTGNGTVTATFDLLATNSTIQVARIDNASAPQAVEGLTGSSSGYSDSIVGTDLGEALVFAAFDNVIHTAGSGFTEQAEVSNGTGSNTSSSALSSLDLTSTGSQAYSGTLSGSSQWAVIALTLTPDDTDAAVLNLGYELSAAAGATSGLLSFNSTTLEAQHVDITADKTWLPTDIPNVEIKSLADTIAEANLEIDALELEIVDSTGLTATVALTEVYE